MKKEYELIKVESYMPLSTSGLHGKIHIRPIPGQTPFEPEMFVQCSKALSRDYPVGKKFIIKAKITNKQGSRPFIYSSYNWEYSVLKDE